MSSLIGDKQMQAGQFVKWVGEDFEHIGMILTYGEEVSIATQEGTMSFPKTDGTLEAIRKPKNFTFFNANRPTELPKATVKAATKPAVGTNLEKAFALFEGIELPSRQDGIARLVSELGLKDTTASTYFAAVKRAR